MHQFDHDLNLKEQNKYRLQAEISDSWSHIGVVNGGFQLALLYSAMQRYARKPKGLIMTGNYINRCSPGSIDVRVDPISSSRNYDRMEARLFQGGAEKLRAFGTFAELGGPPEENCSIPPGEQPAPIDRCVRVNSTTGTRIFENMDILLDPSCAGWISGELDTEAFQKGWIRFSEKRIFDIPSVIMASDSFPPSIFAISGSKRIVPTLEFTIQVAEVPPVDRLMCRFHTRYLTGEMIIEEGELRTPDGSLVAISHQTALFRA